MLRLFRFFTIAGLLAFSSTALAQDKVRLALNWKPEPQFGGFLEAERAGLFKKEKLNLEILPGGSGTPTIQMLATGKTEYAIVSADELVMAHDRGAKDLVALFASFQKNPQGIMVREGDAGPGLKALLQNPKKILMWQSGLPYAQFLSKKYAPIAAQVVPYAGGISYFQKDAKVIQQCFITSEPLLAQKSGQKVKVFLAADEGFNPYTTLLVTTKSRLKEKSTEVEKVLRAVRAGWGGYLKDPSATNSMIAKMNPGLDLQTLQDSAQAQKPLIETENPAKNAIGSMTLERWQTLIDQLMELRLIRERPKAEALFQNLY